MPYNAEDNSGPVKQNFRKFFHAHDPIEMVAVVALVIFAFFLYLLQINYLDRPYGTCRDKDSNGKNYSRSLCQSGLLASDVAAKCKCRDFWMDNATGMFSLQTLEIILRNKFFIIIINIACKSQNPFFQTMKYAM